MGLTRRREGAKGEGDSDLRGFAPSREVASDFAVLEMTGGASLRASVPPW